MPHLKIAGDPENTVIELSKKELQDPEALIRDLCESYPLGKTHEILWRLLKSGLCEEFPEDNLYQRPTLLDFYDRLKKAVIAAYIIFHAKD